MAAFSLGRGSGSRQEENLPSDNPVPPYSRGFELWQQHPHHHHHLYPSSSQLLSFSNEHLFSIHGTGTGSGTRSSMRGGGSASGTSCQDCGNQAKKDCTHSRCRTCCKSRGFQCATHVKSTWVSAAKRRERQQQLVAAATLQQATRHHNLLGVAGSGGGEAPKRPRELILHTSGSRFTNALASSSGGGMEAALSFPSEVSSPAVFRCVRVSPIDDAEVEYAYQAAVSIGGHLFKGMLYDTGPEGSGGMTPSPRQHAESSSSAAATAITTSAAAVTTAAVVASSGLLDPSALYPPPISAFMAGTQFFPHHPRP